MRGFLYEKDLKTVQKISMRLPKFLIFKIYYHDLFVNYPVVRNDAAKLPGHS